jgi:hypothetical protein
VIENNNAETFEPPENAMGNGGAMQLPASARRAGVSTDRVCATTQLVLPTLSTRHHGFDVHLSIGRSNVV